ncbi:MAG: uroporphyrinogen decarboxylase family protein [Clostridia bacterium]|nr:uroporphyrinogen decarboxylase family protein [Clostridia bacterium]
MSELSKREKIFLTLSRKQTGYIPVIPSATSFAIANSPYGAECRKDSQKFAEAMVSARRYFGYDALWAGLFQGVTSCMGQGLEDKNGKISQSGDGTIQKPEDLKKLRPFNIEECVQLHFIKENIRLLKQEEPEEPIIAIMDNPSMVASALMDGGNYYYHLVHNPAFVHELTEMIFEPLTLCAQEIIAAGADILWLPLPTIGGTCISRQHYQEFCMPYNKRFNQKIIQAGGKLIIHTCGNWNDRFDLVTTEGAHCLHIAEADLGMLKKTYGNTTALMGQIPSVFTMMLADPKQVFAQSLADCLAAAEGGGFILSPDCGMPGKTPAENIKAMVAAAKEAERILAGKC